MNPIVKILNLVKEHINAFLTPEALFVGIKVLLIALVIYFTSYVVSFFLKKLFLRLQKNNSFWDDILVKSLIEPLITFIVLFGISVILDISNVLDSEKKIEILGMMRRVSVVVCITWFVLSCVSLSEDRYISRKKLKHQTVDYSSIDVAVKLLRVSILITAMLVVMDVVGVDIKGILAFAGIGGVAVALSAKELLSNFFGTILIYADKPFIRGETIRFPDKVEGMVEKISWRVTAIRTLDKTLLFVPNATFSTIAIENCSRMTHRRIKETIGIAITHADKFSVITSYIKKMLLEHPQIDTKQRIYVNFDSFSDHSINFVIYAFTTATDLVDFSSVKQDIILKAIEIISKNGASIAHPTRTIKIDNSIDDDNKLTNKKKRGNT